jgi:hypothetical protein
MRSSALPLTAIFVSQSVASYSDPLQYILGNTNALQNILLNTDKSNKYHYPTDFTREIVPKPFHSHNDYWRDVPFYTGLSYGAISTEADVWLINGTLHVCKLEKNANDMHQYSVLNLPVTNAFANTNAQDRSQCTLHTFPSCIH